MFSLRIVTTDHYQATPLPDLDVEHSEFRGSDVFKVPVIRVYGSTPGGQKTCMHVHGVFPYLYVPYDGTQPWDRYLRLFASSLDKAINVAQGHPTSNIQHVYKITLVSGIPMYGFHEKEEQFLKIYLYNPGLVKKVADLLLGGAVMNQVFQPHESHIPYTLQMFIDYNLYGMNMLNLAAVKFRRKPEEAGNDVRKSSQDSDITTPKFRSFSSEGSSTSHDGNQIWDVNTIPREMYVEASRQSTCELEVDAVAADILNRLEVDCFCVKMLVNLCLFETIKSCIDQTLMEVNGTANVGGNPGLAALWEDEKQRRRDKGESSQITPQDSQEREDVEITESDGDQQEKFRQIVLQLQPYIDSQSESDDGSQKEELFDASPPPASQVELHLSQREDMSGSSQDTVMLEEEDQAVEPVINLESIHRVVSFSQSFHLPDSQPSSQPLDDTQDRSLAQILAALADESSPPSSQAAASQVSALEEQDSILHDKSIVPDEKLELEDEEETIEMSQMIGIEEEQQDDQSSEHEVSYDLAGIDDTWTDSQIQAVDDKEDDNEEEDKIPQFDGAADEKPDEKPKSKKRLGVRGPIISGHHQLNPPDNGNQAHQSQGHLSYQGNMSGGHMMYGGGSYGSSRSGNTNYVGYQQQQTQQFHPPQHQHHHLQHQQTHHQQHRQQQQQHLGQSHQSHPQGLNTNSGNDLSGNYMNMYGNNSQGWGQTFPVSEQQQRGTGGYGRMESWGSYDERGNQDWSNQMSSVQRNIAVQSPTQHHSHSTLNSPVETLQNINSPPAKMDSPQGMLHSPTAVLQSTHSTLSSPDTILQSPHSNMQSPQSTIQSPPSAVQSPQLTIQSPNHTSTQPNPQQPMSSPGMSSTGSRTPMASPPLPNFRGHQYEGKNSQEYPAGYQQYNYPGGTYNTMDYSAQPPSQNVHGGYSFGSQQQQYYQPSAGHQNNYNQSSYYRAAPNTYLPNPQSRNTGAVDNRTQINFTESKNNFKRKLKQKLMEKQLNSKPLSPPNLQSPTLPRNKGTVSFPSQNTVNCNTAPQKPPHKPQSQLEKLLMADDDDDDSQASQEIGQRSLSRCSNTSNASSSRGSEKPHPPQSSNSSSVSSFSPLPESIRGNENSSLKFSSDSSAIHESSQQTGNSVQSISGRQNSLNGSSDDLFFDNMSQPSSSNTSMFNDLFNPDNLSPPSFQHPPENRELRIDGNLNSPNFQGDLIRSPIPQAPAQSQTPFSQVKKKNTSSFSSLESLENLVSSVQRNTFYGVNVDQQETGGSAHGQHSQGLARSHLNSHESSSGLQNQLDYTDLQGGHINISQSHEEAASRYTKSSQHQHCSDRNMSQSYWNTHGSRDGVNNERSHDHFTQQLTSNAYYQNTQNTNYMKSNSPLKKTHTVPPNYNSRMSGQGHIHQYQALQTQLSQTHHLNHNVSSSSNLNYPAAQKTHGKMAKLKRSLSLPTVPKKRGRPRKCDVNLATARNRSNSVVLENKPLTYNPAYTFAFHVPSPVFKRLKFHNNHPPNDYGIKVVRMHPKDARKYSLMKVGREIVKLQKLTKKQIAEHTSEIAHRKQTLTSVNTESKPMVLDDKTGVMVTVEKSENVEKDSVEGTSKNVIITESETNRDMCGSPMNRSESGNDDTEVSVELDTNTVSNVDRTVSKNGESEAGFSQHDKEISTDLPHGNHVDIHESYSVEQEIQKKKSLDNPVCVTDSSNEYTEKNTTMCNSNSIIGREVQCISNTSVQPLRWNETNLGEGTSKVPVKEECSIPVTEISESQSMLPSSDAIKHQISTGCERTIEKVQAKTCLKDVLVKTSENSSNDSVRSLESDSTDDSIVKKCCKTTLSTHKDKNCEPELYTEIRSTMFNSIIEKVLFHSVDKGSKNMVEKANIPGKKSGNVPVTKCSAQDSVYILNQEGIRNFPSMSGQRKKRQQKRCLSTKKRLKVACNGHSFPPVVDPDREESNNVILKDVNLTEASEGKLTPIRGHTPIAGRSPIRMNTNLEQYRLFDADIINNKEELESKLKLLHPNQNPVGHQPNKIDGNIIEKDEYFDRFCDSPVSSVKSLSSRTSSRKDSSESANSGSESWKTKLSLRKRKSSSAYSNKITGCRKSLRQRKEKSFSFENSGSELDCVFEKERKDPVKKKKKKAKEVAGIDYIVIGRFKGHTSMRVGIERLDIDPDEFVNVPEFIADQVRKGDKNLQKPVKNQETTRSSDTDAHESLRKAQSRTPAFELFTKLQNEAFGEEKVGKDDDKSKEVLMGDDIAEHNTDDCVVGKPAVDFDDEDSNESLKDCQMEDNESDSGSGENKPLLKRRRSRRGSRRKLTRNQKLHVAFLGKRTRKKKSLGNIDKLLNSLSLLHDATIANLNDSSTTSYSDACKTEDFKVKYEDAMFKMSFLSSSDSDRGGISPPHPLSPEELAKDHQGLTRSTSDVQSPVLSASENSLSPAHHCVPYHQKECSVSDLRSSPIYPFTVTNHKLSSGIFQNCSSEDTHPLINSVSDNKIYSSSDNRVAYHSPPPPLLNIDNHEKLYKRDEQVYCTQGGIDIKKATKAIVKLKPLSNKDIEQYCCKSGPEQASGSLLIEKRSELVSKNISLSIRDLDALCQKEVSSNYSTSSPPDLGPPNIPKYPNSSGYLEDSDLPPPLLIHRSPRSQKPDFTGYGMFENSFSKSPASCCSSGSLNVVHSDRFSDISEDEEDDESRVMTEDICKDTACLHTSSMQSYGSQTGVINSTHDLPVLNHEHSNESPMTASAEKTNIQKNCTKEKSEVCNNNISHDNLMSRKTPEQSEKTVDGDSVKGVNKSSDNTSRDGELFNHEKELTSKKQRILTPSIPPPSRKSVQDTAAGCGLNTGVIQPAYYSNPDDLPEQPRELGGRVFKVQSFRVNDLTEFEGVVECEGLKTWRDIMMVENRIFSTQDENESLIKRLDQEPQLRFAMMGDRNIIISPCKPPPGRKEVERWAKGRKLWKRLKRDNKSKIDKNCNANENNTCNLKDQSDGYCGTSENMDKNGNNMISKTRVDDYNDNVSATAEVADDSAYLNDTIMDVGNEQKHLNFSDSLDIVNVKKDDDMKMEVQSDNLDNDEDIISPSPPSGQRLSQFSAFDHYRHVKSVELNPDHLSTSTPTRIGDVEFRSQQTSVGDKELTNASTPSISNRFVSLSQGGKHSTPIQRKRLANLFGSAFTPIKSGEKESTVEKMRSNDDVNKVGTPRFAMPRKVPLPRRQSSNSSDCMQRSLQASQLGQFATPVNKKGHVSQIDAPTPQNSFGFKVSQQNLQNAKALHEVQNLTILSMELHAESRVELRPDPEVDPILAIFYSISNDVSPDKGKRQVKGAIIVDRESADCQDAMKERSKDKDMDIRSPVSPQPSTSTGQEQKSSPSTARTPSPQPSTSRDTGCRTPSPKPKGKKGSKAKGQTPRSPAPRKFGDDETIPDTILQKSGVDCELEVTYVREEAEVFSTFLDLVARWDPDIFVGYEIQNFSWGFLLQRAAHLSIPLTAKLSRIPEEKKGSHFSAAKDEYGADHASEIHVVGRIVLNLWRLIRHEVTLNIYSFENVTYHVLHHRIPHFSFRTLNLWFSHRTHLYRWRVIEYYLTRVNGNLQIMEQLDLIGRTSEFARVFGIEFYDVLSRGSQYRVESMMLRLAKPLNYIPVSPSVHQRARMRAPECIPLTLEPESRFYADPVVVVDFQSLYPSIMIAHNYCFCTCLGRLKWLEKAHEGSIEFGCTHLKVPPSVLKKLQKDITVSPNGVVFVKEHIRKGVISSMVEEILNTRIMVKKAMKEHKKDKGLHRLLDARQLGLKLIANVTYGYTGANFSGRMPCIEVGDSIVRKARETLERAIKLVEDTPRWGARVVYGDTDSMFIELKGRSKDDAFKIGYEICDAVTAMNPKPMKLKFEKVYLPCILQTKKRYVGFSYETPDQKEPIFDAKGIETVRRDACTAVSKILEKCIKILFTTRDVSQVKQYVVNQCRKTMEGKVTMQDFIFAKEFRGLNGYKPGACVPALEISRKLLRQDRRAEPRVGERVPYVIVYGPPGLPLIQLVRQPRELLQDPSLRLNATYYITKQILPPLDRVFSLMGVDVFSWYNDMPKFVRVVHQSAIAPDSKKGTISHYFCASNCPVCDEQTNQNICNKCMKDPQTVCATLNSRMRHWDKVFTDLKQVCNNCMGVQDENQPCVSLDCPILFRRIVGKLDASKGAQMREVLEKTLAF